MRERHVQKVHPCAVAFIFNRARDGRRAVLAGPLLREGELLMRPVALDLLWECAYRQCRLLTAG